MPKENSNQSGGGSGNSGGQSQKPAPPPPPANITSTKSATDQVSTRPLASGNIKKTYSQD